MRVKRGGELRKRARSESVQEKKGLGERKQIVEGEEKKNRGTERGKRIVERKNVIESDARIMGMKMEDSGRLEEKG